MRSKKTKSLLRVLLYKTSSKLKKLKTNFEAKTSFSESELISRSKEDENNGSKKSETSDGEYLSDFTKMQPYMHEPCVSKEPLKRTVQEKNHQIQKKALVKLEKSRGTVNTNQWLLMQEALAAWINVKFVKVISKVYFHLFLKYFYPVTY